MNEGFIMTNGMLVALSFLVTLGACRMDGEKTPVEGDTSLQDSGMEEFDLDGDGYSEDVDCDDSDSAIHPDAEEICDGVDNDCNGEVDDSAFLAWYADIDGDGYGDADVIEYSCTQPEGYTANNDDCNDVDREIHPGMDEFCDGIDNNCDGQTDEGVLLTLYADADGDGYGNPETNIFSCEIVQGWSEDASDCNDIDATIHPGAEEVCDDVDHDCDGMLDNGLLFQDYYVDNDRDGYGVEVDAISACARPVGYVREAGDCDDDDANFHPGAEEDDCTDPFDYNCDGVTLYADEDADGVAACEDCDDQDPLRSPLQEELCDGIDNNCDDVIDEGVLFTYYRDVDGDLYGVEAESVIDCTLPEGYAEQYGDCNDADASYHPYAQENCSDVFDYNCDGSIAFEDADGDGVAACEDCNDADSDVFPGQNEFCDGIDNNCDDIIDGSDAVDRPTWYFDEDGDGYGEESSPMLSCNQPLRHASVFGDCAPADPDVSPSAEEICNGVDDNCNGQTDENVGTRYYLDFDEDGYGDPETVFRACADPGDGYVTNGEDCDDLNDVAYPHATEVCDGFDNNCDNVTDMDAVDRTLQYLDADGDGHGSEDPSDELLACGLLESYALTADDCDDDDETVYPEAEEVCDDLMDNNCDGYTDEDDDFCPYVLTYTIDCQTLGTSGYYQMVFAGDLLSASPDLFHPPTAMFVYEYNPVTGEVADAYRYDPTLDSHQEFNFTISASEYYVVRVQDSYDNESPLRLEKGEILQPTRCGVSESELFYLDFPGY